MDNIQILFVEIFHLIQDKMKHYIILNWLWKLDHRWYGKIWIKQKCAFSSKIERKKMLLLIKSKSSYLFLNKMRKGDTYWFYKAYVPMCFMFFYTRSYWNSVLKVSLYDPYFIYWLIIWHTWLDIVKRWIFQKK